MDVSKYSKHNIDYSNNPNRNTLVDKRVKLTTILNNRIMIILLIII